MEIFINDDKVGARLTTGMPSRKTWRMCPIPVPEQPQVKLIFSRRANGQELSHGQVVVMAVDNSGSETPLVSIFPDGSIGRWYLSQAQRTRLGLRPGDGRLHDFWGD